jgi:hypothetical protein
MGCPLRPAFAVLAAASALVLGAAGPTVKDEMKSVVDPTSNVIFAVGGEVDPSNGPDAAKVGPERCQARPGEAWTKAAEQLRDLAATVESAARAKDGAKLSGAANDLGDTCSACHSKYKTQS